MMKKEKTNGVQLLIRCVVRDPAGKVISDTGRKPAKSYVIQFLEFIYGMGLAPATLDATETDGTEDQIYNAGTINDTQFNIDGAVNDDRFGIVVGTGDTAVDNIDHKLETQLTEGVGAGDITHGQQVIGSAAVVGANVDLVINRAFTNNTGVAILVKEAGLYCNLAVSRFHMLIRDVLGVSVNVPYKCSLTIIYTVRTTV